MPIYAYKCASCGHRQDVLQKISDPVLTACPACGADAFAKQVTAAGFQLKGSGWYATDFRDAGAKAKAESTPEGKTEGGAAPAADSKAADKVTDKAAERAADKPADKKTGAAERSSTAAPAPAPAPSSGA
jgi:putative FmdB family regulatory protein